jgi:hypothetical protein
MLPRHDGGLARVRVGETRDLKLWCLSLWLLRLCGGDGGGVQFLCESQPFFFFVLVLELVQITTGRSESIATERPVSLDSYPRVREIGYMQE